MNNDQTAGPDYVNRGFQYGEERPPPYAPVYPSLPSDHPSAGVPRYTPSVINTHQPMTPAQAENPTETQRKGSKGIQCRWVLCGILSVLSVLAVAGVLLWYFLYYQCLLGKTCGPGGACLSASQWCDGVKDCSDGQDESQCFRLHGTNFLLQSFSSESQTWKPVCAEDWNDDYGKATCEQIGYQRVDYVSSTKVSVGSKPHGGYMKVKSAYTPGKYIQSLLTRSQSCTAPAVSLRCIECGVSDAAPRTRIVGGTQAVRGAWPWQVSLQINGQHVCGGSIISKYWIVSAAHCFQKYSEPALWTVHSGHVSLVAMNWISSNNVKRIINHKGYDPDTSDNDIALLRLSTPLTFSREVRPVCLPNVGVNFSPERQAWITGWGALRSQGSSPDNLMQAEVTIYSRDTCNRQEVLDGKVTETMICAGKLEGGVDSCQGDSGGPLVAKEGQIWWLVGDTSWGIGCAWRNKPGIYGNVSYFIDWIYEQMKNY